MSKDLILESTTLWDFPTQNYGNMPHGNNKYNGVTPAFVIWNLLQRYTKEGDLVVDPMCGSGTTIDVATELNRKVIGYDLNITRPEIIKNDSRKIPLADNSVDFVFIDSPYSDNIKYSEDSRCIGKISCERTEFYDELEKTASEIARILKPNKAMGWVIGVVTNQPRKGHQVASYLARRKNYSYFPKALEDLLGKEAIFGGNNSFFLPRNHYKSTEGSIMDLQEFILRNYFN